MTSCCVTFQPRCVIVSKPHSLSSRLNVAFLIVRFSAKTHQHLTRGWGFSFACTDRTLTVVSTWILCYQGVTLNYIASFMVCFLIPSITFCHFLFRNSNPATLSKGSRDWYQRRVACFFVFPHSQRGRFDSSSICEGWWKRLRSLCRRHDVTTRRLCVVSGVGSPTQAIPLLFWAVVFCDQISVASRRNLVFCRT